MILGGAFLPNALQGRVDVSCRGPHVRQPRQGPCVQACRSAGQGAVSKLFAAVKRDGEASAVPGMGRVSRPMSTIASSSCSTASPDRLATTRKRACSSQTRPVPLFHGRRGTYRHLHAWALARAPANEPALLRGAEIYAIGLQECDKAKWVAAIEGTLGARAIGRRRTVRRGWRGHKHRRRPEERPEADTFLNAVSAKKGPF